MLHDVIIGKLSIHLPTIDHAFVQITCTAGRWRQSIASTHLFSNLEEDTGHNVMSSEQSTNNEHFAGLCYRQAFFQASFIHKNSQKPSSSEFSVSCWRLNSTNFLGKGREDNAESKRPLGNVYVPTKRAFTRHEEDHRPSGEMAKKSSCK